jgi:unspecific monooxygenase
VSILLLNAGHEATVHQLGNAIYTLLKQYAGDKREQLCSLLADDDTADSVVAECLRYAAPLHLFTRFAQQHITLADEVTLEPGEKIGLLLAAANRCPLKFNQANRFIPERSDAAHLSLGAGIHYCVGAQLAKVELRTALQVLFKRLPQLELVSEPDYQDTYHFHGLQQLLVRW